MITQVLHCPYCHGSDVVRHSKSPEGKQCYRCRECPERGRTFLLEYSYAGQSPGVKQQIAHSTELRGGACHRSTKAFGGEDLQVEEPVACGDCASFHFYATLAGMLRPTLIGDQVIGGEPALSETPVGSLRDDGCSR
jgi:hypothetical protein